MKKIITSIVAAVMAMFIAGCNKDLTPEKARVVAKTIGTTAGYACELVKANPEVKEAVIKVIDIVSTVVPTNNQSYVEAWTPVIDAEIEKLVKEGKLNEASASVAKIALNIACEGIDYFFDENQKANEKKEIVNAAIAGFVEGFKSVISLKAEENIEIDEDAMKFFKSKLAK